MKVFILCVLFNLALSFNPDKRFTIRPPIKKESTKKGNKQRAQKALDNIPRKHENQQEKGHPAHELKRPENRRYELHACIRDF